MAERLRKKPRGSYHHPDLERALVDAAVRTIREEGIDALTLRSVGARLGVSRTALYRHFPDKAALLARVALEGFSRFRRALQAAVDASHANGGDVMEEMATAYVDFAMNNQSHYKTMFGGSLNDFERYPDMAAEGEGAFLVLLNAITDEQKAQRIAAGDSLKIAQVVWAGVHGIVTLAMAGQLNPHQTEELDLEGLVRLNSRTLRKGLAP